MQFLDNLEIRHKNLSLTPNTCTDTSFIFKFLTQYSLPCVPTPQLSHTSLLWHLLLLFPSMSGSFPLLSPFSQEQPTSSLQNLKHEKARRTLQGTVMLKNKKFLFSCMDLGKLRQIFNRRQIQQPLFVKLIWHLFGSQSS